MSESTVETTTNGPSLESILWGAAERWNDTPGIVDRDEFANYIFDAWGGDSPSEAFVDRFFHGDQMHAKPEQMAEAINKASRGRMHVYNFDLNRLEYVVIEDKEQVVLVSEQGQFALPNDDYLMAAIERAVIPDSKNVVGSNTELDRKTDGTARAYFVRQSGEIVALDVNEVAKTVQQLQLQLKPVFAPLSEDPEERLRPFSPNRTSMMPNREVELLQQDSRVMAAKMTLPPARSQLVSLLSNSEMAAAAMPAPATADTAVLLLLPDGTLARPVIGSGSRWRDMVSDWTQRAAMLTSDAARAPAPVLDKQRFVVDNGKVLAIFTGSSSSTDSETAPGGMGLNAQLRAEALVATRMLGADVRILGDDDLAQAVLGGAQLVSSLSAPILADTRPGTGFWIQPELLFQASNSDRQMAQREMALRAQGYSSSALDQQMAAVSQPFSTSVAEGATSDTWSNWALQAGGQLDPSAIVSAALFGRDVEGGDPGPVPDPSALALFARKGRGRMSAPTPGTDSMSVVSVAGQPLWIAGERVVAFRAADGSIVAQQAAGPIRLASADRSVGDAGGVGASSGLSALPRGVRRQPASIAYRTGALPATAIAALMTSLERTAAASGYKLPRAVSLESATDALETGRAMAASMPADAPQRSSVRLAQAPFLNDAVGRMVLSMPFPSAGELVVGSDLNEALTAWLAAPAIPASDTASALSGGSGGGSFARSFSGASGGASWIAPGLLGGAAGGALAGLAMRGGSGTPASGAGGIGAAQPANDSSADTFFGSFGGQTGEVRGAASPAYRSAGAPGTLVAMQGGSSAPSTASGEPGSSSAGGTLDGQSGALRVYGSAATGPMAEPGALHQVALSQAQRASLILQMPSAAQSLSSRATLARMPRLLARALDASGSWLPGAGTPLPSAVRDFALSGPFDLPELAGIGPIGQARAAAASSPGRALNAGEDEIAIPMPLWAQMGRGEISTTDAIMASPRARAGYAPPLGMYQLVAPERIDLTGGASALSPGVVTLQGPTDLGVGRAAQGGVQATDSGGQFVLGRIPVADGSQRSRMRVGAPLSPSELGGLSGAGLGGAGLGAAGLASALQAGSMGQQLASNGEFGAAAGAPQFEGAGQGELVAGRPMAVPTAPDVRVPNLVELQERAVSPTGTNRPLAMALRAALAMSNDVSGRMPGMSSGQPLPPGFGSGTWTPQGWAGAPGSAGGSLVVDSSMPRGLGISSYGNAGQGSLVAGAGGSSAGGAVVGLGMPSSISIGMGTLASGPRSTSYGAGIAGVPPGAWSGASPSDPGYTPWMYGSSYAPASQSVGGVNLSGLDGLGRPSYPSLPTMLRFRYVGAPLWWSSSSSAGFGESGAAPVGAAPVDSMSSSLRSGLNAATSAAAIWRSIFVSPGRQSRGAAGNFGSTAGGMDHGWDRNADDMASLSSKMSVLALSVGGGAAAGGAVASRVAGPETVYVAMDSAGRAGIASQSVQQQKTLNELKMSIVAAIPPAPPALSAMGGGASSTDAEARPRQRHAKHDEQKTKGEGVTHSKIEGSVDAIAQRIYHRICRRLETDRERFGG